MGVLPSKYILMFLFSPELMMSSPLIYFSCLFDVCLSYVSHLCWPSWMETSFKLIVCTHSPCLTPSHLSFVVNIDRVNDKLTSYARLCLQKWNMVAQVRVKAWPIYLSTYIYILIKLWENVYIQPWCSDLISCCRWVVQTL